MFQTGACAFLSQPGTTEAHELSNPSGSFFSKTPLRFHEASHGQYVRTWPCWPPRWDFCPNPGLNACVLTKSDPQLKILFLHIMAISTLHVYRNKGLINWTREKQPEPSSQVSVGGGLPSLIVSTSKTNTCCVSKKEPLVLLEPMWCVGTHVYVCNDPVGHDSKRPNYIHACTSIFTQPKYIVG